MTANTPVLTLPVDVPAADADATLQSAQDQSLTISISAGEPYWHIKTQAFDDWQRFKTALLSALHESQNGLTIAVDKTAPTEPLLKLLSLLNEQQTPNTKIIMEQP